MRAGRRDNAQAATVERRRLREDGDGAKARRRERDARDEARKAELAKRGVPAERAYVLDSAETAGRRDDAKKKKERRRAAFGASNESNAPSTRTAVWVVESHHRPGATSPDVAAGRVGSQTNFGDRVARDGARRSPFSRATARSARRFLYQQQSRRRSPGPRARLSFSDRDTSEES